MVMSALFNRRQTQKLKCLVVVWALPYWFKFLVIMPFEENKIENYNIWSFKIRTYTFIIFLIGKLFFISVWRAQRSFQTLHAIKVAVRYHYESVASDIIFIHIKLLNQISREKHKLWFQYMGARQLKYNYKVTNSF